ncbi:hypothetical protein M0R04_06455 [Candidatus Dojkabacteria bacterium]|jgi:hypothetical protein|nr:hypothetical protein [Candidatus Dojkabacteria bacterium]
MKSKKLNCECVAGKKICNHLIVIDFDKDLIEFNVYKKKKLLGGVVVKKSDIKKFLGV